MSVWGQMQPWPDAVEGIGRLKRKFTISALSNAGMATVVSLSKRGRLEFDAVLTGELVRAYKPAPEVYKSACTYLGFKPAEIMMVAAHKWDLKAAKEAGFKTAFVPRPLETGPSGKIDVAADESTDVVAKSLIDLARMASA
jgi:2-haloacid dehalogenase